MSGTIRLFPIFLDVEDCISLGDASIATHTWVGPARANA